MDQNIEGGSSSSMFNDESVINRKMKDVPIAVGGEDNEVKMKDRINEILKYDGEFE